MVKPQIAEQISKLYTKYTNSTKRVKDFNPSIAPQPEVVLPRRAPLRCGSRPALHGWTRAAGGGPLCPELAAPANNTSYVGTGRQLTHLV